MALFPYYYHAKGTGGPFGSGAYRVWTFKNRGYRTVTLGGSFLVTVGRGSRWNDFDDPRASETVFVRDGLAEASVGFKTWAGGATAGAVVSFGRGYFQGSSVTPWPGPGSSHAAEIDVSLPPGYGYYGAYGQIPVVGGSPTHNTLWTYWDDPAGWPPSPRAPYAYDKTLSGSWQLVIETEEWGQYVQFRELPAFGQPNIAAINTGPDQGGITPTAEHLLLYERVLGMELTVNLEGSGMVIGGLAGGGSGLTTMTIDYKADTALIYSHQNSAYAYAFGYVKPAQCSIGHSGVSTPVSRSTDFSDSHGTKRTSVDLTAGASVYVLPGTTLITNGAIQPYPSSSQPSTLYDDREGRAAGSVTDTGGFGVDTTGKVTGMEEAAPVGSIVLQGNNLSSGTLALGTGGIVSKSASARGYSTSYLEQCGYRYDTDGQTGPGQSLPRSPATMTAGPGASAPSMVLGNRLPSTWNNDSTGVRVDRRIRGQFRYWQALEVTHKQSQAVSPSWTLHGDMVLNLDGSYTTAGGAGYLTAGFSPAQDWNGYGKLAVTLKTLVAGGRVVDVWVNKETYNIHTGHQGKHYQATSGTAGVAATTKIDLLSPLNPTRNTDEMVIPGNSLGFSAGPQTTSRDYQQTRWNWQRTDGANYLPSDNNGPFWGVGAPVTELRLEGFAAGESYFISDVELVVDAFDRADLFAGNDIFRLYHYTRFGSGYTAWDGPGGTTGATDWNNYRAQFGFLAWADGKQHGEFPSAVWTQQSGGAGGIDDGKFRGVSLEDLSQPSDLGTGLHVVNITDLAAILNTFPDWTASALTGPDSIACADRPAADLFGGGYVWDGSAWQSGFWVDLTNSETTPVSVPACVLLDSVELYPDCGDWTDPSGSYGGNAPWRWHKNLGLGWAGVVLNSDGSRNPTNGAAGYLAPAASPYHLLSAGDTDGTGFFRTGAPYGVFDTWNGWVAADLFALDQADPDPSAAIPASNPAAPVLYESVLNAALFSVDPVFHYSTVRRWRGAFKDNYHYQRAQCNRLAVILRENSGVGYRYASNGTSVTEVSYSTAHLLQIGAAGESSPVVIATGSAPAAFRDDRGVRHLVYGRSSNIYYRYNLTNGAAGSGWSDETMALSGHSCPGVVYAPGFHRAFMATVAGGHCKVLVWKSTGPADLTLSPDLATEVDLGTSDSVCPAIELFDTGHLQVWWSSGGNIQTKTSSDSGRTWV